MNGGVGRRRGRRLVAGALTGIALCARPSAVRADTGTEPPQVVSAMRAPVLSWRSTLDAVGNLRAEHGVDLAFETPGIVSRIDFRSGQAVAAGDVLAQLRLDEEPGVVAQLKAQLQFAALSLGRSSRLLQTTTASRSVVDQDQANLLALSGQLDAEQARIREKTLTAPFGGQLGIRQVDLGQFLPVGTVVVTLQSLDPIDADFFVSEQQLRALRIGDAVGVSVDAWKGRVFGGTVQAITPAVDRASRTVLVRAQISNADHALVPGMFAAVRAETGNARRSVTLPSSAVSVATYGSTVYVLRAATAGPTSGTEWIAHQVPVRTGAERGNQVEILSGLSGGEEVVTAGQIKLHDGSPVVVNDEVQPDFDPDPHPPQE